MKESDREALTGFTALGLDPKILAALTALGYEEPTPIQRAAIPPLLAGHDMLGQAATGTGKTAAFALPLLQSVAALDKAQRNHISALVLTPTRELAVQVAEAINKYGRGLGVTVLPIYGGADMRQQLRALSRGVDIVVATPGRAVDHIRRKSLVLTDVRMIVLDEADEMLDMGFAEDLDLILGATAQERQTALFSATMAPRVRAIAKQHLRNPVPITIVRDTLPEGDIQRVRQVAYIVSRAHKAETLNRVLDMERPASALIFCRTRTEVDELTETVRTRGYSAEALHGGMSQEQRDRVMKRFRANTIQLLIATDVAARGLDVKHLACVVNYDVPASPEAYVHRIGRTGRAGRGGVAITLAEPRERGYLSTLERATKHRIELATIPTSADLRAHRISLTRTLIHQLLLGGELDSFGAVADSLSNGTNMRDVAAAAIKAAHEAGGAASETAVDIPVYDLAGTGTSSKRRKFASGGSSDTSGKTAKYKKRYRGDSDRHRAHTLHAHSKPAKRAGRAKSKVRSATARRQYKA